MKYLQNQLDFQIQQLNLDFDLIEFNFIDDNGNLYLKSNIKNAENLNFGGGFFCFQKNEK